MATTVTAHAVVTESPPLPCTFTSCAVPVWYEFAPILNFTESWPELLTVQAGSPVVSMTSELDVVLRVHVLSEVEKPVPVTVISVGRALGGPVTGGLPLVGLNVTAGLTVKVATAEMSPLLPATVTEYACPGAAEDTRNCEPATMVPVESIWQIGAATNVEGVEEIVQPPTSVGLNLTAPEETVTGAPAIPDPAPNAIVGVESTVKTADVAKSAVGEPVRVTV